MRPPDDLTGRIFGSLTAVRLAPDSLTVGIKNKANLALWLCECDCGGYRIVRSSQLKSGEIDACKKCVKIERYGPGPTRRELIASRKAKRRPEKPTDGYQQSWKTYYQNFFPEARNRVHQLLAGREATPINLSEAVELVCIELYGPWRKE